MVLYGVVIDPPTVLDDIVCVDCVNVVWSAPLVPLRRCDPVNGDFHQVACDLYTPRVLQQRTTWTEHATHTLPMCVGAGC